MKLPFTQIVKTEEETKYIANELAQIISPGDCIALIGNLGAGKTMFTKGLCSYYHIQNVDSPTFAIINVYSGYQMINHIDFYRIDKINELYDIGIEEYIYDNSAITVIEWADMFSDVLPSSYIEVSIELTDNSSRKISIERK